jgi:hypothetical protein
MRLVAAAAGLILVLLAWLSILRTVFVPAGRSSFLARWTTRVMGRAMLWIAGRMPRRAREEFLGYASPLMLFGMAVIWAVADSAGYALLAWGTSGTSLRAQALANFFTLRSADPGLAAAAWLSTALLLTAFAVHLMRVTSAYSRREHVIGRLSAQAKRAPDAEVVFAAYARSGSRDRLGAMFGDWANWMADVQATHLDYPALVYYRSDSDLCWTEAAQIILDCAALVAACTPGWAPPETSSLLTAGEHCLSRIAACLGIRLPSVPVSYQGRETYPFSRSLAMIRETGLLIAIDDKHAQQEFQRRRVGYAPFANAIYEYLLYHDKEQKTDSDLSGLRSQ